MQFLNWDQDNSYSELCKTVVIFGAGRGGTSLLAGMMRELGVCMGENPHPIKYEFDMFPDDISLVDMLSKINFYNKKYKNWGWKSPKDIFKIDSIKHHLKVPYFIIVFRNIVDVANSANKYNGLPFDVMISETTHVYAELANFIKNTHFPIAVVSYEDALSDPENLVCNLLNFLGMAKLPKTEINKAIKFCSGESYSAISEQLKSQDALFAGMLRDDVSDSTSLQKAALTTRINELTAANQNLVSDLIKANDIVSHLTNKFLALNKSIDCNKLEGYLYNKEYKDYKKIKTEIKNYSFYHIDSVANNLYLEYQKIFLEYKLNIKLREEYQRKIDLLVVLNMQSYLPAQSVDS